MSKSLLQYCAFAPILALKPLCKLLMTSESCHSNQMTALKNQTDLIFLCETTEKVGVKVFIVLLPQPTMDSH